MCERSPALCVTDDYSGNRTGGTTPDENPAARSSLRVRQYSMSRSGATGSNEKRHPAGILGSRDGQGDPLYLVTQSAGLFLDLLNALDRYYPAVQFGRVSVVDENSQVYHGPAVA